MSKPTGPRKFHFNLPLLLATLVVLSILIVLGTWQANRYHESISILEDYTRKHDDTPPVTSMGEEAKNPQRDEALRFRRVALEGKLVVPELQLLTARYKFAKPGFGLLVPLAVEGGPHEKILVYLGWVPRERLEEFLKTLDPDQVVKIEGRLNKGDLPGPSPAPVGEHLGYPTWRNTNLSAIRARVDGLDPDLLIQSGEEATGQEIDVEDLPLDGYKIPLRMPPAKHIEYSLTWYGVGFALVLVYLAFSFRRTWRPGDRPEEEETHIQA
jgi:cytochrome oxidase assembly protein ShyY1